MPDEWRQAVANSARSTPGVVGTKKCRIRKGGTGRFVELHVRVDPKITVFEGHEIGHRVKERILAENPLVRDVLVHIEPADWPGPDFLPPPSAGRVDGLAPEIFELS